MDSRRDTHHAKQWYNDVVEERTKSKPTAQHTKEEIRGLENFLRLRLGITWTEVSSVLRHYGVAMIA